MNNFPPDGDRGRGAEERRERMVEWKCLECGYTLNAERPPEECPSCKEKCEFVDVTCYIPDCGKAGRDPRLG